MVAIIPCAGYGKRMKMKKHQSKEMLINPATGNPLIKDILDICFRYNLNPHIITRKEKKDLIKFLKQNEVSYQIIEPKGEWCNTVLASMPYWDNGNILILPDTVWEPVGDTILNIRMCLSLGNRGVFAVHYVDDISKWGSIKEYRITEKSSFKQSGWAWGLIGFNKNYGEQLFKNMIYKDVHFPLRDSGFVILRDFKDLTRSGKIT